MKEEGIRRYKLFVSMFVIVGMVMVGVVPLNTLAAGSLPDYDIEQDSLGNYHKAYIDDVTGIYEIYYTNDIGGGYPQDWNPPIRITFTPTQSMLLDLGIYLTTDTMFIIWHETDRYLNSAGMDYPTYYTISQDYGENWMEPRRSYEDIMLKYANFDPLFEEPELPACYSTYTSPYGYYIVQMKTPMIPEWREGIETAGGTFQGYIPNNAHIVKMTPSVKDSVEDLPYIRWIGIYHPMYKFSEEIRDIVENVASHVIVDIDVMVFDDINSVINQITALGGIVESVSDPYLKVKIDDTKLYDIGEIPDIEWTQGTIIFTSFNDLAVNNGLMNVVATWNNPTYGLTGTGQIVAVADTGLDTGFITGFDDDGDWLAAGPDGAPGLINFDDDDDWDPYGPDGKPGLEDFDDDNDLDVDETDGSETGYADDYDVGEDGLGPDDPGYPGPDTGEADGIYQVGEDGTEYIDEIDELGYGDDHDVGADGIPGTQDEGEGDGLQTPGEPCIDEDPIDTVDNDLDGLFDEDDVNHADFGDRVNQIFSLPIDPWWNALVNNPGADDGAADTGSGHGTHVTGSVLGDGTQSAGAIRGVANDAQLVFQALEQNTDWVDPNRADGFALTGIPTNLNNLFQPAYDAGARVHTNSWGAASNGQYFGPAVNQYELNSQNVDQFVWTNRDMVILFAVGNDGTDADGNGVVNNPSIGIPATAKNCISVGATENLRPNVYDSDFDGRLDEDRSGDWNGDGWPGVRGDDDGDGFIDYNEYQPWIMANTPFEFDDDEDGAWDEDPIDGFDNDNDGLTDEDPPGDVGADGFPGAPFVDDDGDGFMDYNEYQPWLAANTNFDNDDDEDGAQDEDPIDGINNDADGLTDEDPGPDINGDGWPGQQGVDEDGDTLFDYNDYWVFLAANTILDEDDDEDWDEGGGINEGGTDPPGDANLDGWPGTQFVDEDLDGFFNYNDYQVWLAANSNLDEDDDEDGLLNEDTGDTWGRYWPNDFPGPASQINGDHISNNPQGMAAFSSRGNTADGRTKPDIVAPGTWIISTRSSQTAANGWGRPAGGGYNPALNNFYTFMGGTSMATPLTAGTAALVRQYYEDLHNINPSAALVKGTLINGATDITGQYIPDETGPIPNSHEGWGRVDLTNSILPTEPRILRFLDEDTERQFDTIADGPFQVSITDCDPSEALRVTLVWTDPAANPAAGGILVNDLDLRVTDQITGTTVYYGNDFTGGSSIAHNPAPPTTPLDTVNNVECVYIPNPSSDYIIEVEATTINTAGQTYALVISYGQSYEEIRLWEGWNLISLPLQPDRPYVTEVLRDIDGDWDNLQYFDASDSADPWKHHKVGKPFGNDLSYLYQHMGFWIYYLPSGYVDMKVYGAHFSENQEVELFMSTGGGPGGSGTGWNMVGYPSGANNPRDYVLNNLLFNTHINMIQWFNGETKTWHEMPYWDDNFIRGRGYWFHMILLPSPPVWQVPVG